MHDNVYDILRHRAYKHTLFTESRYIMRRLLPDKPATTYVTTHTSSGSHLTIVQSTHHVEASPLVNAAMEASAATINLQMETSPYLL